MCVNFSICGIMRSNLFYFLSFAITKELTLIFFCCATFSLLTEYEIFGVCIANELFFLFQLFFFNKENRFN